MTRLRDSRRQIAEGIYTDGVRYYATRNVRGAGFREKRFPLAVPIDQIQAWRNDKRAALLEAAKRGTIAGTLGRDAKLYLRDFIGHLASAKTRRIEINHWIKDTEWKNKPRALITSADIAKMRSKWLSQGVSPKTINNRCGALRHLYHCLDGRKAWTPLDELEELHVHKTPIRVVDDATILAVDQHLQQLEQNRNKGGVRGRQTRARFRVLMSTGRRPSELMRTERGDVDLERRVWLPRDGKGGFSPGIYLNDDMLAAWQFFIEVNVWGEFDTHEHAKRLRLAGWPKDIDPYQARHTVGITLSERGIDLDDVGSMLGHKRRETTRKHYVPVLNSRMQKASEVLAGRFHGWPRVQSDVQNSEAESGETRRKTSQSARGKPRTKTRRSA